MIYSTDSPSWNSNMDFSQPSIERDAVRMIGLKRRADLNGC